MEFLRGLFKKSPEKLQDRVVRCRREVFEAAEKAKDWVDTLKAKKYQLEGSNAQRMRLQMKLKSYLKSLRAAGRDQGLQGLVKEEILTHLDQAYGCYLATCALYAFIDARRRGSFSWRDGIGIANTRKYAEMHVPAAFKIGADDLKRVIDMRSSLLSSLGMQEDVPAWETDIAQYKDMDIGSGLSRRFLTGYKVERLIRRAQKYASGHPLVKTVSDPVLFTQEFFIDLPNQR